MASNSEAGADEVERRNGEGRLPKYDFEVLTAVSTKMAVFWVVAAGGGVVVLQRLGGGWGRRIQSVWV
jgi:shikimate kinase